MESSKIEESLIFDWENNEKNIFSSKINIFE